MGMGESGHDLEPMSPSADDVFVNLDINAFDILGDLSDLDHSHHNGVLMGVVAEKTTIVDVITLLTKLFLYVCTVLV
jgi:hypothetical protein